jgi:hypothetical protein
MDGARSCTSRANAAPSMQAESPSKDNLREIVSAALVAQGGSATKRIPVAAPRIVGFMKATNRKDRRITPPASFPRSPPRERGRPPRCPRCSMR